ncbi:MAG TPA: TIGR04282 family arsenosugar biosynthesis glycosyltransferase, partial [Desulfobacteria bacterium]|nr:TIGR04282 family arsenosugar biosynthesis glycosyltransferase [Desulfobacteria bacterium]
FPQKGNNLGERMANAVQHVLARGHNGCIVIGADIPTLQPDHIESAVSALGQNDLVLGPAEDGGYYLVALKRALTSLFAEICWGTDIVLAQTLERAEQIGLSVYQLPRLNDIDLFSDLEELYSIFEKYENMQGIHPWRTWSFLQMIFR